MAWFKVDDRWARHPKVRRASKDARLLWAVAGVESAANETDGVVDALQLQDAIYLADLRGKAGPMAAASLVEVGLWHDAVTVADCKRCGGAARTVEALSLIHI